MKNAFVISLFLISTFQVIHGNFFDSVHDWFSRNFESQLEVREPLPDTGYWNFLAIAGLYGRMLHYLLTDTNGYGAEIKVFNQKFKDQYGDEYYANLESHVAESFPVADTLFRSRIMLAKISNIRDKESGRTLEDAFHILNNIANDRGSVQEIVDRWGMVKDISNIFKNPESGTAVSSEQVTKLRTLLLEHPEVFQKLLAQPDVLNQLSGSVFESLKDIDLVKGIKSVQEMAVLLKTLFPDSFEHISKELLEIRDQQTGLSFADGLETVSNVMKTPVFQKKLQKLLNTAALSQVHEISQQPLEQAIATGQSSGSSQTGLDAANPQKVKKDLEMQGVFVSEDKAGRLIDDARHNRVIGDVLSAVSEAENSEDGLTPASISQSFARQEIKVSPDDVRRLMQLMQVFPPEMMVNTLKSMGIEANIEDVRMLVEKAAVASPVQLDAPAADVGQTSSSGLQGTEVPSAAAEEMQPAGAFEENPQDDFEELD